MITTMITSNSNLNLFDNDNKKELLRLSELELSKIKTIFATLNKYNCNFLNKLNKENSNVNYILENAKWTLLTKLDKLYDEYDDDNYIIIEKEIVEICKNTYYKELLTINNAINLINNLLINKNSSLYNMIITNKNEIKKYIKLDSYELQR